jgi:REP element-mobilizing transposase RayT
LRIEAPGLHHVVTRGNNKRAIYADDHDRTLFCLTLARIAKRHDWRLLAYVLMRNHYHLLLGVGENGLSAGMCQLNTAHAVTYNVRHGRINHLLGKRFWNRYLMTDDAVRSAARYIVQNPIRAGGRLPLERYRWSSYAATVGLEFPRMTLARDELLSWFGDAPEAAIAEYRRFCAEVPDSPRLEGTWLVPGTVT